MIAWAPVFHFYQPPTQFPDVLKKICRESYRPLIELLSEFERARATVNINGSLTQMLLDCGGEDVVSGLLDRALHSCQFWWASRRPMWDLNMVERGLAEQRAVALNAMKALTMSEKAARETADDRYAIAEDLGRRVRRQLLAA